MDINQTSDLYLLALNSGLLMVILFSVYLLLLRSRQRQLYQPLAISLLCVAVLMAQPAAAALAPDALELVLIISLPALLLIAPCLYFYVQGLTGSCEWTWRQESKRHLIPFYLSIAIAVFAFALPVEMRQALLVHGEDNFIAESPGILRYPLYGALILTFVLVMGWVVQSAYYAFTIFRQLRTYRKQLKDMFASTEQKEIWWLSWLLYTTGIVWLVTAINLVLDNLFFPTRLNDIFANVMVLIMVWSIAVWGLRQKPGFEEIYNSITAEEVLSKESTVRDKYQRSPLDAAESAKIAGKINTALQEDKLYLDSALSLQKLSRHIGVPANYISQTLNETLDLNFFDFVNKHRVEAAKILLLNTDQDILIIAMDTGFNAKSSFYSAFKKVTQQTPGAFRKAHVNL